MLFLFRIIFTKKEMLGGLIKDTAVYGLSSILGRLLNWALVPLYTRILVDTGDYGIVTHLYAWTALLLILLTYGMETGFFRFVNKENENPKEVYSTTLLTIGTSSFIFLCLGLLFLQPLSQILSYPEHKDLIAMLLFIVASDAFMSIPFAYLRYQKKPWVFASLRLTFIFINIALNLFFLLLAPYLAEHTPKLVNWFFDPNYTVGYIFVANFIGNVVLLLLLQKYIFQAGFYFSFSLMRRMLRYSLPILVLGLVGIFNQMADKILFPLLIDDLNIARQQLGIYGACFKITVIMMMFTQAFRYAYEPIIFNKKKGKEQEERSAYALAMKFFIISSLFVILCIIGYLDVLKYLIGENYYEGLKIIPIVLWGQMMIGVYFNLSLWYKLTDRTYWGGIISAIGCLLTVLIIILGTQQYGFMACAWASAISNSVIVGISYIMGQRYYKVDYKLKNALFYLLFAGVVLVGYYYSKHFFGSRVILEISVNTIPLLLYLYWVYKKELKGYAIIKRIRK